MHIDLFQQLTRHITFWLCNYCSLQNQTGCQYCMFLTNNNPIPLKNSIHVDFPSLLIDQNQDILYSGSYFDHILALFFVFCFIFFPQNLWLLGIFSLLLIEWRNIFYLHDIPNACQLITCSIHCLKSILFLKSTDFILYFKLEFSYLNYNFLI